MLNVNKERTAAIPLRLSTHIALICELTMTSLGSVLKMNFVKPKFRELLHISEICEHFVPQKFPAIQYRRPQPGHSKINQSINQSAQWLISYAGGHRDLYRNKY